MTETNTCRWGRATATRVLPGRHLDDCDDLRCPGCVPCPEQHCRVCHTADVTERGHGTNLTCGTCLAETRTALTTIGDLATRMLGEAIVKGIQSTAAAYTAPIAQVEYWRNRRASAVAGRIDRDWFSKAELGGTGGDEHHPHWAVASWELEARRHLKQLPDPTYRPTLSECRTYLDTHLTRLAHDPDFGFDEMAESLQACITQLENILYDGTRPDRTRVTCTTTWCRKQPRLERAYADDVTGDVWKCPDCGTTYDDKAYREAHTRQLRHAGAQKYLPFSEARATLAAQGRNERTIWRWLAPLQRITDVCTVCGTRQQPDEYPACPVSLAARGVCGGILEPEWSGDRDALLNTYCDLKTRRVWVWWPDIWARHLAARTRRRAA